MDGTKRVAVAVRVRPVLRNGVSASHQQEKFELDAVTRLTDTMLRVEQKKLDEASRSSTFTFDHIFDQESTQLEVYEDAVVDLVDAALAGNNATILAYGQTGSGKTHTVLGDVKPNPLENDLLTANSGLFLRVLSDLMEFKRRRAKDVHVIVGLSCVEIYNETIRDLFGGSPSEAPRTLKAVMVGDDVHLPNLIVKEVTSLQAVFHEIQLAISRRQSRATESNATSSRSHCLFLIDILQQATTAAPPTLALLEQYRSSKHRDPGSDTTDPNGLLGGGGGAVKKNARSVTPPSQQHTPSASPVDPSVFSNTNPNADAQFPGTIIRIPGQTELVHCSKILLADLAGSEKTKNSGVSGEGLAEATSINCSLTALGNVVHSLYEGSGFVSYRTSNLTRLLKPTFSQPTSRVLLLAQASPTQLTFDETVNTFYFANKVKAMKVVTTTGAESEKLQFEVMEAEKQVDMLVAELRIFAVESEVPPALLRRRFAHIRSNVHAHDAKNFKKPYKDKERKQFLETSRVLQAAESEKSDVAARRLREEEDRRRMTEQNIIIECDKIVAEYRHAAKELRDAIRIDTIEGIETNLAIMSGDSSYGTQTILLEEDSAFSDLQRSSRQGLANLIRLQCKMLDTELESVNKALTTLQRDRQQTEGGAGVAMTEDDILQETKYATASMAHCAAKRFFASLMELRETQYRSCVVQMTCLKMENYISAQEKAIAKAKAEQGKN